MSERETLTDARPRMRVTFVFEYDPYVYSGESLTPEEIAKRDTEDMNSGDLTWDDLDAYTVDSMTVEPVERP